MAPRACACSSVSSTSTPAPSPITNPSRSLSNGRLAVAGSSLRKDRALALANPATPRGVIADSAPPHTIASALPSCSSRKASPMALEPAAQAVATAELGPLVPRAMAARPVARLGIIIGTVNGLTRPGPLPSSTWACVSMVSRPPTPEPMIVPMRSALASEIVRPASAMACLAATTPNLQKRSQRLASFGSINPAGSKSFTSAAKRQAWADASNRVMASTPFRPEIRPFQ